MTSVETWKPEAKGRLIAIDHAKSIGIALVVFGHCWRGLHDAGLVRSDSGYGLVDIWIYSFHMPLFFFISGVFIERSVVKPLRTVLAGKAATLLYPYLVWSTLHLTIHSQFSAITNRQTSLAQLPETLLLWPASPFWFLYVLFIADIVYILARRARVARWWLLSVGIMLLWVAQHIAWTPGMYFASMFAYLSLGAVVSATVLRLGSRPPRLMLLVAVCGGVLVTVCAWWCDTSHPAIGLLAAICGIAMVLALGMCLARFEALSIVSTFGVYSLHILVMHVLLASGLRIALSRYAHVESVSLHLVAGMVIGLIGPVAFVLVTRRIGGEWLFQLRLSAPSRPDAITQRKFSKLMST